MKAPYYLLVEVLDDYGIPVDIDELVQDMHNTRGLDVRVTVMVPAHSQTHTHGDTPNVVANSTVQDPN